MPNFAHIATQLAESGFIPDSVIRLGIRRLLRERRKSILPSNGSGKDELAAFVNMMNQSPIALVPQVANEQHYEVPASFFTEVLGKHRKYSCCYWDEDTPGLDEAELASLRCTAERAGIADGMDILDLGCGWGSFSLYAADALPDRTDHVSVQFLVPARLHRGTGKATRIVESACDHDRHERFSGGQEI